MEHVLTANSLSQSINKDIKYISLSIDPVETEIPEKVENLIDNKMYRNKFKALIRRGHLQDLLELADLSQEKEKPSHWFAKVTAKKNWELTLQFLRKLRQVAQQISEVVRRLKLPQSKASLARWACLRDAQSAIRNAITASEVGNTPARLFSWLTLRN